MGRPDQKAVGERPETRIEEIETSIGYPCFVKPANLGSSVGIGKAENAEELNDALDTASRFDRRIIVEEGVDAREIEVSVLGNEDPDVSVPGEILIKKADFYDYEAKYVEGGMELVVPAPIRDEITQEIRRIAGTAYGAIDAAGMARVDFFLERGTDRLLLNEINTIPGFTPTSAPRTSSSKRPPLRRTARPPAYNWPSNATARYALRPAPGNHGQPRR